MKLHACRLSPGTNSTSDKEEVPRTLKELRGTSYEEGIGRVRKFPHRDLEVIQDALTCRNITNYEGLRVFSS